MGQEEEQIFYNTAACSAIIMMGLSVGGIIIGLDHAEATCSNSFMKLQTWLLVWGIVSLVLSFILAVGARIKFMMICQLEMFLSTIFNIIFTIIGAVLLWRDSIPCRELDPPLYRFSMAIIILNLIAAYCRICCGTYTINQSE